MTDQNPTGVDNFATEQAADADKTRYAVKKTAPSDSAPVAALQSGLLIKERYLLENKIGSGGMSDIYRATDLFLQQAGVSNSTVAIKVLQQQFVDQPDAAAFLTQIEQDAPLRVRHCVQRAVQLRAAIAFQAAEDIAGEAFRMEPHQGRAIPALTADHQRDMLAQVGGGFVLRVARCFIPDAAGPGGRQPRKLGGQAAVGGKAVSARTHKTC